MMTQINELANHTRLQEVLSCINLPQTDNNLKSILNNFAKNQINNTNYFKIGYKQIIPDIGRDFGNGLQLIQKDVRNYLINGLVYDLDMKNSQLVILYCYFQLYGIHNQFLYEYITDREGTIKKYNLTDKTDILSLMNYQQLNKKILNKIKYNTDFVKLIDKKSANEMINKNTNKLRKDIIDFHNDIYKNLLPKILKENRKLFKKIKDYKIKSKCPKFNNNRNGVYISYFLQQKEREILFLAKDYLEQLGYEVNALIFDGFHVNKSKKLTKNIIKNLNEYILKSTGFCAEFSIKSTNTEWKPLQYYKFDEDIIDIKDEYPEFINLFDNGIISMVKINDNYFKIKSTICPFKYTNINPFDYCNCNTGHGYIYKDNKLYGSCRKCGIKLQEINMTPQQKYDLYYSFHKEQPNLTYLFDINDFNNITELANNASITRRIYINNCNNIQDDINKIIKVERQTRKDKYDRLISDIPIDYELNELYELVGKDNIEFRKEDSKIELNTKKCFCNHNINHQGKLVIKPNEIYEICPIYFNGNTHICNELKPLVIKNHYFNNLDKEIDGCSIITKNYGEELLEVFLKYNDILLQSNMGTSKSINSIKYLKEYLKKNPNARILFITYRQSLAYKHKKDLEKLGFSLYLEEQGKLHHKERLVICWNSAERLQGELPKYDLVFTDEIDSILSSITSSVGLFVSKDENDKEIWEEAIYRYELTFSILCNIIRNCGKFIGLDAKALTRRTVEFIMKLRPNINLIKNTYKRPTNKYCNIFKIGHNIEAVMKIIKMKANTGKFIGCFTTEKDTEYAYKFLKENCPNLNGKIYTSKTNKEVSDFDEILNVNEEWKKYDYILYTSAIPSAISFTDEHFDFCFVYSRVSEGTGKCNDMLQQIMRSRILKSGEIIIFEASRHTHSNYNKDYILDKALNEYKFNNTGRKEFTNNSLIQISKDYGTIDGFNLNDIYTNLYFNNKVENEKSFSNPSRYYKDELEYFYDIPTTIYSDIEFTKEYNDYNNKNDIDISTIINDITDYEKLNDIYTKPDEELDSNELGIKNIVDFCNGASIDKSKIIDNIDSIKKPITDIYNFKIKTKQLANTIKRMRKTDDEFTEYSNNINEQLNNSTSIRAIDLQHKIQRIRLEQIRRSLTDIFDNSTLYNQNDIKDKYNTLLKQNNIKHNDLLRFLGVSKDNLRIYDKYRLTIPKMKYILDSLLKKCYNTSKSLIISETQEGSKKISKLGIDTTFYELMKEYVINDNDYYCFEDDE